MDIKEIIKDAFVFPSKNLETLSIFAILTVLSSAFAIEGVITCIFGIFDIWNLVMGIIYIIIAIIIGLITRSISLSFIKSGIEFEDKLPDFIWWKSFGAGFNKVIITIYYFIVPALIVVILGFITNLFGGIFGLVELLISQVPNIIMGNSAAVSDAISNASLPLLISLGITISVGLIIFLIFSFFQVMAEARLAKNGRLRDALNVIGAARDIKRIGVLKVIQLSIIIFVIVSIVEIISTLIFDHLLVLSILTIIITPYITLFGQRALGLLYSDIV